MREIKFRGLDKANKKWLYGSLEIPLTLQNNSKHYILGYSYGQYQRHEVDPKTVGQFIGIKDKNGQEIYEGDILKINNIDTLVVSYGIEQINEDAGSWEYLGYNIPISYSDYPEPDKCVLEIIGNIHENK